MPVKSKSRNQVSESDAPDVQGEPVAGFGGEQAAVSGRKLSSSRVPLAKPIRQHIGQLASDFRKKHGPQDRRTGDRIALLFRSGITPRRSPGRPPTPEVRKAVELRQRGTPWPKIFPVVIPDYWNLLYEEQYCRRDKLRRAVSAYCRRRRNKRRKRRREKDSSPVHTRSDTA